MPPIRNTNNKPKNAKASFKKLLMLFSQYKLLTALTLFFLTLQVAIACFTPILTKWIMDDITTYSKIAYYATVVAILTVFGLIFAMVAEIIGMYVNTRIVKNLRYKLVQKVSKLPLKYYDGNTIGNTLSRITNDADSLSQNLPNFFMSIFQGFCMIVGLVIAMFSVSWQLALSCFIALPIGFIILFIVMAVSNKYFKQKQAALGKINGKIEETFSGINVVKLYSLEESEVEEFYDYNEKLKTADRASTMFGSLYMAIFAFTSNLSMGVIALACCLLAYYSSSPLTWILLYPVFNIFASQLNSPLANLSQGFQGMQICIAAGERIFDFLEEKEMDPDLKDKKIKSLKGNVDFKHVKFGYSADKTIINDFSVNIKPGMKVAIVGPTGAGKTTIVNLLMRFYEIDSGSISIDGISIKDMNKDYLRSLFGMVLQDAWTFNGTIKENIIYTSKNKDENMIKEICKDTNLNHVVSSLPKGYDTILDEKVTLSAGEKQLLTIARAMIQNAPMMILDEATSNTDTRTEIIIQNAMDKLTKGRTSFVIAHRLSTIKNADLILVMDHGDIVEQGNHKTLLKKKGFYANLYNSQFSEE